MKKYFQVMKGTWEEYMTYRLNFILWRVRVIMQLLVVYFLWTALFSQGQSNNLASSSGQTNFFGFTKPMILSYIVLTGLVRTFVLGTTTMEIGSIINQGDLSNYLIRPLNFFSYYLAKDTADKILNLVFAFVEISLILFILRPMVFIQVDPGLLVLTIFSLFIGMGIYFSFSIILSFLAFWTPDIWAPRFLSFVIIEFFAGGLFPLDILPKPLFILSQYLPFSYFIYFPLTIYIGHLNQSSIIYGLIIGIVWAIVLWSLAKIIWKKGLKEYAAQGR